MIGIMLTMAVISTGYALWTTKERQDRHPWMPKTLEPIALRRPLDLPALGYLPKDCKLVAGLHVAEMMQDAKTGKILLAEPRPTYFDWPLKQIKRTSGLTLDDVDHVVLGAADLKQLVMVVKTRNKISLEKIADARPMKSSKHEERPYYEFPVAPVGQAILWCVDDETLIYVMRLDEPKREHLSGLTTKARAVEDVLPGPLHDAVAQLLPKRGFAWSAGRLEQLGELKFWLPILLGGKVDVAFVKEIKIFAVGLEPMEGQSGLSLSGAFLMTDADAAAKLAARLKAVKIDGAIHDAFATPKDARFHSVNWQVRGEVATLRRFLNESKDAK